VAGAWSFVASAEPGRWKPGRRRVTTCFLDAPPLAVAERLGALVHSSAWGHQGLVVLLAGPFETITPWCWDWFDDERPAAPAP